MAVEVFFIISGFYMSLILNEKYNKKNSYKLFISNRALRLFPTYIFVLIITVITIYIFDIFGIKLEIISDFQNVNFFSKLYSALVNLLILGQDTSLFLGFDSKGALHFVGQFRNSKPLVWHLLLCPPAWSLSLELMFYAIAPFLIRRRLSVVLILMALAFTARIVIYSKGYYYDPWTYRFFPLELFFFLSGNVAYRIYKYAQGMKVTRKVGIIMLISSLIFLFVFNFIPITNYIKQYMFYFFFIFSIPFIFQYTKRSSADRFIGELSYPVYIIHWFILSYFLPIIHHFYPYSEGLQGLLATIFSIGFSYLIIKVLIKPIDNYREKRVAEYS